jgi:hypothetical protein
MKRRARAAAGKTVKAHLSQIVVPQAPNCAENHSYTRFGIQGSRGRAAAPNYQVFTTARLCKGRAASGRFPGHLCSRRGGPLAHKYGNPHSSVRHGVADFDLGIADAGAVLSGRQRMLTRENDANGEETDDHCPVHGHD